MTGWSGPVARDGVAAAPRARPEDGCGTALEPPQQAKGRGRRGPLGPERGAVTVEMVGVIPLLVVVTLAMVGVIAVARDQVLAQGAAREGAREAALGSDDARTVSAARAALPAGRPAAVSVLSAGPDRVRVRVELGVRLLFGVPPVTVRAEAVALREPGPVPRGTGP
jgi:TadE-like protein